MNVKTFVEVISVLGMIAEGLQNHGRVLLQATTTPDNDESENAAARAQGAALGASGVLSTLALQLSQAAQNTATITRSAANTSALMADVMSRPTAEEVQVTIQDARNLNQEVESAARELRALLNSEDFPPEVEVHVRQVNVEDENLEDADVPSEAVQAARQASLTAAAACLAASAAGVTWELTGADLKGVIITTLDRAEEANVAAERVVNDDNEPQTAIDAAARVADAANVMAEAVRNASDIIDGTAAEVSLNAAELASQVANGSVDFQNDAQELVDLSINAQTFFENQLSIVTDDLKQVMTDAAEVAKEAEVAGRQASQTFSSSSAQNLVIATDKLLDTGIRMVNNVPRNKMGYAQESLVVSLTASAAAVSATCSAAAAAAAVGAESAARAALNAAEVAASAATLLSSSSNSLLSTVNAAMAASQGANNATQSAMAELQNGLALDTLVDLAAEMAQMASGLTNSANKVASAAVTRETIKDTHEMVKQMDNDWKVLTIRVQYMLMGTPEECCKMLLKQLSILNVAFNAQVTMEAANRAAFFAVNVSEIFEPYSQPTVASMKSQAGVAASTAKLAAKATDTSLAATAKSSAARMVLPSTAALLAFVFSIL